MLHVRTPEGMSFIQFLVIGLQINHGVFCAADATSGYANNSGGHSSQIGGFTVSFAHQLAFAEFSDQFNEFNDVTRLGCNTVDRSRVSACVFPCCIAENVWV